MSLPAHVRSVLIGCIIGDATCTQRGNKAHIKLNHSTKQIGYTQWKLQMLSIMVTPNRQLSYSENLKHIKGYTKGKWFNSFEFTTIATLAGAELGLSLSNYSA